MPRKGKPPVALWPNRLFCLKCVFVKLSKYSKLPPSNASGTVSTPPMWERRSNAALENLPEHWVLITGRAASNLRPTVINSR